ncbi:MAG TPA: glycosyltransferase, partial [Acidobacteria bacterium]|nr:glycosyltransferase [Acidobacteriota bacterium]
SGCNKSRFIFHVQSGKTLCATRNGFPTVEVVVVDDGSDDGTWEWLRRRPYGIHPVRQDNAGPATARNRGVREASGDVVLFLGDDTVPEPGWLGEHLETHRVLGGDEPLAVLGYTGFPPDQDGAFLRWINEYGAQFGYLLIDDAADVPFNFFYTSNVSLPRQFFLELGGFREDFPAAAWEDIELAYRAVERGMRFVYRPLARTVHHHRIDPSGFARRQRVSGRSAAIFARLHPELAGFLGLEDASGSRARVPGRLELAAWTVMARLAVGLPGIVPTAVMERALRGAYLRGVREGVAVGGGDGDG